MHIKGLIAAPFTPMNQDFSINLHAIEKLAQYYHEQPLAGIFINGTTGEGMSLSVEERIELANQWIKYAKDDFKIIVHVGHTCLNDCRILASHAQEIRADAISTMATSFFKWAKVDDLVEFCSQIAVQVPDLPFYYYHMPSMTGAHFKMINFLEVACDWIPNLAGIKFTHENLMDYRNCLNFQNNRFDMLFGRDEILLAGLSLGASGAVGSTYNYASPLYTKLMRAFEAGDVATARRLQDISIELITAFASTNCSEIAANKYVMQYYSGIDLGPARLPLTNLTDIQKKNLRFELDKIIF